MNFIKKNKVTIIIIGIFAICVFLIMGIINAFFPEEGVALYGNRLDGIDKVAVSDATLKELEDKFKEDAVASVSARTSGRIIEIVIVVNDDVAPETAKIYGAKALEVFSDEQKAYYDIQVFAKKNIETAEFPIIGYKHKTKDSLTWTKDRRSA